MITINEILDATITRIKAVLPAIMATSVIGDTVNPEEMTGDILRQKHAKGLFIVGYQESTSQARTETVIVSVLCCARTPQQVLKLGQVARMALSEMPITGASSRMEFHADETSNPGKNIFISNVQFRVNIAAVPPRDIASAIAALNL